MKWSKDNELNYLNLQFYIYKENIDTLKCWKDIKDFMVRFNSNSIDIKDFMLKELQPLFDALTHINEDLFLLRYINLKHIYQLILSENKGYNLNSSEFITKIKVEKNKINNSYNFLLTENMVIRQAMVKKQINDMTDSVNREFLLNSFSEFRQSQLEKELFFVSEFPKFIKRFQTIHGEKKLF